MDPRHSTSTSTEGGKPVHTVLICRLGKKKLSTHIRRITVLTYSNVTNRTLLSRRNLSDVRQEYLVRHFLLNPAARWPNPKMSTVGFRAKVQHPRFPNHCSTNSQIESSCTCEICRLWFAPRLVPKPLKTSRPRQKTTTRDLKKSDNRDMIGENPAGMAEKSTSDSRGLQNPLPTEHRQYISLRRPFVMRDFFLEVAFKRFFYFKLVAP